MVQYLIKSRTHQPTNVVQYEYGNRPAFSQFAFQKELYFLRKKLEDLEKQRLSNCVLQEQVATLRKDNQELRRQLGESLRLVTSCKLQVSDPQEKHDEKKSDGSTDLLDGCGEQVGAASMPHMPADGIVFASHVFNNDGSDRQEWDVVGGISAGVLVRVGQDLNSPEAVPPRLTHGAIVKQVTIFGGRLEFELLSGHGPKVGWVSIELAGKRLLARRPLPPFILPASDPGDSFSEIEEALPELIHVSAAHDQTGNGVVDTSSAAPPAFWDPEKVCVAQANHQTQLHARANLSEKLARPRSQSFKTLILEIEGLRQVIRGLERQLKEARSDAAFQMFARPWQPDMPHLGPIGEQP